MSIPLWVTAASCMSATECDEQAMQEKHRKIVLIYADDNLAGYFQYSLPPDSDSLYMEDMQIQSKYQGSGVFSAFYSWLVKLLPDSIQTVEAHAGKTNYKSQAILEHLGLKCVGENKTGNSFHYKGYYSFVRDKFS